MVEGAVGNGCYSWSNCGCDDGAGAASELLVSSVVDMCWEERDICRQLSLLLLGEMVS